MTDETSEPASKRGGTRKGAGRPAAPKTEAVREVRTKLGHSQEKFAALLGCTYNALRVIERENRLPGTPEVMQKFARFARETGVPLPEGDNENQT